MTVREIAKMANVSAATISLVINNKPGVSDNTRKKIMKIIENCGYLPREKEEKEVLKKTIRFVKYRNEGTFVDGNGDFINRVMDGVEDETRARKMNLKITNVARGNLLHQMIKTINEEKDDGIIFLGTEFLCDELDFFKNFKAPVVVLDNEMNHCNVDAVLMNNENAVYMAMKHLKSMGHKEIGLISSRFQSGNCNARKNGFHLALSELNLVSKKEFIYTATAKMAEAVEEIDNCIKNAKEFPTAFFAENDILALGALNAFKRAGFRIPEDISIIGMDDLSYGLVCEPKLTTIKIHKKTMGQIAVSRLGELMEGEVVAPTKILLGCELIIRESVYDRSQKAFD